MTAAEQRQILRENRWICVQMEQYVNRCLAPVGLTAIQAYILLYILRHSDQGTSLTAIHREFGYSMPTLSGMLKRLRSKGYVRVEHCDGDDRRKLLFGTEKGQQVHTYLDRSIRRVQDRLCDHFTQEELDTLSHLQGKMLENLSALREQTEKEEIKS
ncbi:MarR family winged helix-turn-helix transcriptional regulator [Dysosmobacter sp.]|uniref:MarR family winged helix-turn-helix transcriptional regulator n=1 Tax=Dysosmobacter sp. TaxID=2591382 RepID=UPI003A91DDD6